MSSQVTVDVLYIEINSNKFVFGSTECKPCSDLCLISIEGYALSCLLIVAIMLSLPLTISGLLAGMTLAMSHFCFNYSLLV